MTKRMMDWYIVKGDGRMLGVLQSVSTEAAIEAMRQQMLGQGIEHIEAVTLQESSDSDVLRATAIAQMTMLINIMQRLPGPRIM